MFQTFEATTDPGQGPGRLAALRDVMRAEGVDAFLVPRADRYQGEYVADCDARLAWLTGFTGSAGFAAVLVDRAGVFIDGRYRVQVRSQVADVFTPVHWPETSLADWLVGALPRGAVVAYDPWLHTVTEIAGLTATLAAAGISLRGTDNLVDRIWHDRPGPPEAPFAAQPLALTGTGSADKRAALTAGVDAGAWVITLPDSIAWLLNIRGRNVARNPVPHATAVLHHGGSVDLFAEPAQVAGLGDHLDGGVRIVPSAHLADRLAALTSPVRIDPASCPQRIRDLLTAQVAEGPDPCILPKARKTPAEIAGARAAHLRDGAAMVRFLAWLDAEAPKGTLTEIAVVRALEGFRRDTNALRDISFETICGAGAHGAIVHYRVTDGTDAPIRVGELLLVDSGGQYADGTTDITRTVIVGKPSDEHRDRYTRVLQGMVAISRAQFPRGVAGQHLDALARAPLWMAGLDYDHGTGHGVGSYLSVHEGPQGLSRRSTTPLEPGMILSNEPGYYREGAYGIRIENLITVVQAPTGPDKRDLLAFETLTHVPLDRRLIDLDLLSRAERDWIDGYHARTLALIGPQVTGADHDWLVRACAPL
ncbi:Xaa-Pro aminopeptidase [Loktanella fryxellensis]|uniref:Xaa-Pro aminopeptidase n=1 Tax=Loktanella fryxellensis TaxID=245187 RepID=A0A1H7Z6L5_9RHOB|nr:aminopeptidase P family protein [Loktanella fryxellensis]SEM53129.1 Xaa-Pro aminopeptidase [Loktanella fryxellensis]